MNPTPWPVKIRLRSGRKLLVVAFDDGCEYEYSAEFLRVHSPSAEVQGHHPSQKLLVTGKDDVLVQSVESVGNYAVRLVFDDGHDSGIYSWSYLYDLGKNYDRYWQHYRDDCSKKRIGPA